MRILGIDEAGRGCVLGPLVVGAFLVDEGRRADLIATGVTDSKLLSPRRREALVPVLHALGTADLRLISPAAIDAGNVNRLEMEAMADLIRTHRPDRAIIDAPVNPRGIRAFVRDLAALAGWSPEWVVEPKADLHHVEVGAASVLAKVRRDAEISALGDVGSGYPSDPRTRAWLQAALAAGPPLPSCIRTRWGTLAALSQGTLDWSR